MYKFFLKHEDKFKTSGCLSNSGRIPQDKIEYIRHVNLNISIPAGPR